MSRQLGPFASPVTARAAPGARPTSAARTSASSGSPITFFTWSLLSLPLDEGRVGPLEGPRGRARPAGDGDRDGAVVDVAAGQVLDELLPIELGCAHAVGDRPRDVLEPWVAGDVVVGDRRDPNARSDHLSHVATRDADVDRHRVARRPDRQ